MIAAPPDSAQIHKLLLSKQLWCLPIATKSSLVAIQEQIRCKRRRTRGALMLMDTMQTVLSLTYAGKVSDKGVCRRQESDNLGRRR